MTEASSRPTRAPRPARRPSAPTARRRRLAVIGGGLALLVAVVVVLLLRGGGSDDARSVVARGFSSGDELKTAQVNIKLGLTGSAAAGNEPVLLELVGPYQAGNAETAKFRFAVGVNDSGGEPVATLTGIGGRNYVSIGEQQYVLADDALDDLASDDAKDDEPLSLDKLGIDPESWLEDPEIVGEEQWDGNAVTHVRSKIDVERMTDDLQKFVNRGGASDNKEVQAAASQLGSIGDDVSSATMDVWVGEGEGALRRLQVDVELKQGRLALDFGLTKVNEPVRISTPKNARPFDELLSIFSAATGDPGATGTSTEPSAPTPDAPPATTTSEAAPSDGGSYTDCVAAAGSDVTELQACADLQD